MILLDRRTVPIFNCESQMSMWKHVKAEEQGRKKKFPHSLLLPPQWRNKPSSAQLRLKFNGSKDKYWDYKWDVFQVEHLDNSILPFYEHDLMLTAYRTQMPMCFYVYFSVMKSPRAPKPRSMTEKKLCKMNFIKKLTLNQRDKTKLFYCLTLLHPKKLNYS